MPLRPTENALGSLEVDLNHRLRFGSGELVITTQRLLARFPDETAWNAWELAPDLALSHHDHAGVGTLELRDATGRLAPGGLRRPGLGGQHQHAGHAGASARAA